MKLTKTSYKSKEIGKNKSTRRRRRRRANNIPIKRKTYSTKRSYMFQLTFESFSETTQTNISCE